MMKLYIKNTLLLLLFVSLGSMEVIANGKLPFTKTEFKKSIKKTFNINSDGNVAITNKYGNVNLRTWSKSEVKIDITIIVNARSESAADDVFERIDVEFANRSDYVAAQTVIESQKSNWWGSSNDKSDFTINYDVSIPQQASLELSNKYGNAEIEAIGGNAFVTIKYGNFNLHSVGAKTEISLGYGNGTIGEIGKAKVDVKYSKIKLKKASNISVDSKYSKIYVEKAEEIKSSSKYDTYDLGELRDFYNEGKYDNFNIEKVSSVSSDNKYSHFKIETLYEKAAFEMSHGGVKINDLQKGFDQIYLDCDYTDCKIYMDDNVSFQLDAEGESASIRYPSDMEVTHEKQKNSDHEVKGHRGSSSAGKIKAQLRYGGLRLR